MTTDPDWLPTARALAEVWDGPPLAQFVVSEGETVHRCLACDQRVTSGWLRDKCPHCGAGGWWSKGAVEGDAVTVPDLTSAANGGVLYVALCGQHDHVHSHYAPPYGEYGYDVHSVQVDRVAYPACKHYAHAAALALLAAS